MALAVFVWAATGLNAQSLLQNQRMLELFQATENGETLIMMSYRDSVLYPLYETRKEMTALYGRFWENDFFLPLQDLNVDVVPDGSSKAGIVIVLEMRHKVGLRDPGFEMHERFGRLLLNFCRNRTGKDAPIVWKVAVDTTYGDQNVKKSAVSSVFGSRHKVIYQEPAAKDSAAISAIQEKGGRTISMPAIDIAFMLAGNYTDRFVKLYAPGLAFDGFKYGRDAEIHLKRNPIDQNSILLLFTLNRAVARRDPELGMHKNLAEKMMQVLTEEMRNYAPAWLDFKAAADTTGGRDPYVLLITDGD